MPGSEPGERIVSVAVVDDDASLCRSLSRLLRAAGIQPVAYSSAEAFLEDADRPQFDCLLLDVQLGGISGLELSRRLSAAQDTTPVIFITAQDDPELRTQAMAEGCAGFFRKTDPGSLVMDAIQRTTGALGSSPHSRPSTGGPEVPESSVVARSHSKPL